jgi:hypothetical protein
MDQHENTIVNRNKIPLFFASFFSREKKEGAVMNESALIN